MLTQLLLSVVMAALPIAHAQEAKTSGEAKCGLGGIVPETTWPGTQNAEQYAPGSPKVCKPSKGVTALRFKNNTAGYEQFVFVSGDKVTAILREYDAAQEQKVLDALKARYGEPTNPNIEAGEMGLVSGKQETRMVWIDATCNTRIEFVHQESGFFKGKVGRSTRIAVLVTASGKKKPGDSPNPLD